MEILLVEDNYSDVFLFRMFLEEIGSDAHLTVFSDGTSTLEYLSKAGHENGYCLPDLIVLDLNLPHESGFEILSEIKKNYFLHDIKVIIFTTSEDREDAANAKRLGAIDYFTKPIDISEYEKIIRLFCYIASTNHQIAV